jgi:hypothetical protein
MRAVGFDSRAEFVLFSIVQFGSGLQRNPLMELVWGRMSAFDPKRTLPSGNPTTSNLPV